MCECYKIGGPWISFDPDCPEHGYSAREAEKEQIQRSSAINEEHGKLLSLIAQSSDTSDVKKKMIDSVIRLQSLSRPNL